MIKSSKSPRTSRPSTPSKSRSLYLYSPGHSRSRTSLPHPKVLPFPDLPVRPVSVESSRTSSPSRSPALTRRSSSQDVNRINEEPAYSAGMMADGSSDSVEVRHHLPMSFNPTSPSAPSPLHSSSTPPSIVVEAGPSRSRALTTPASSATRPIPVPPVLNLNGPMRTHGFDPVSLTPPVMSSPLVNPPVPRASSLPTPPVAPIPRDVREVREAPRPPPPVKKLSNPPHHAATAMPISPVPLPDLLSDHMYQSFRKGTCADVRLFVREWGVGWLVHKMVLVQAGFFHSLFLGGFSETNGLAASRKRRDHAAEGDDWHGEDVELTFDDPNITRAAFEISLSRLYSPFPHLHFPSTLLPTPQYPLTPSFPPVGPQKPLQDFEADLPPAAVLATPRLLLSIVATTTYLGHATLMREALSTVLRTVGPGTVDRYLSFAVGGGIGEEEWPGQDEEGARGLQEIARPLRRIPHDEDQGLSSQDTSFSISNPSSCSLSDEESKVGGHTVTAASERSTPTIRHSLEAMQSQTSREPSLAESTSHRPHFYGFASNKLGEASACWLARWGVDLLDVELTLPSPPPIRIWAHRGLPANFVRAVLSADTFFVKDEMERYSFARKVSDLRRKGWEVEMEGKGDLSIHESIAESEEEGWELWEEDEEELAKVFADGVYYTHMTFNDLSTIAADIDPTTLLPFAPISVLQAAHWGAADLRTKVMVPSQSETAELGLSTTVSALMAPDTKRRRVTPRSRVASASASSLHSLDDARSDRYHLVPIDDTYRMGAGGLVFLTALPSSSAPLPGINGLPDMGPDVDTYSVEGAKPSRFRPPPQGERTQFGLTRNIRTTAELLEEHALSLSCLSLSDTASQKWTKLDPYRFSVEFWGVDKLAEKERAYSKTHFYAGSWFNVYIQTIRKKDKGTQLGIYLHRQSPLEAFPTPSAPAGKGTEDVRDTVKTTAERVIGRPDVAGSTGALGLNPHPAALPGTRMYRAMSTPPVTLGSPVPARGPAVSPRAEARDEAVENKAPYKDPRKMTQAYFCICCSSALGTALIRFASAPDTFTLSQSWGWKSSALRSEEYLTGLQTGQAVGVEGGNTGGEIEETLEEGVLGWVADIGDIKEGSLRATVVVGVV